MRNVWKELQDWNEAKAAHYERLAYGYEVIDFNTVPQLGNPMSCAC